MCNFVAKLEIIRLHHGQYQDNKRCVRHQTELKDASVVAGFPSPADDYRHKTLNFIRDYMSEDYIEMQMS